LARRPSRAESIKPENQLIDFTSQNHDPPTPRENQRTDGCSSGIRRMGQRTLNCKLPPFSKQIIESCNKLQQAHGYEGVGGGLSGTHYVTTHADDVCPNCYPARRLSGGHEMVALNSCTVGTRSRH
jgi:hypothetical protein